MPIYPWSIWQSMQTTFPAPDWLAQIWRNQKTGKKKIGTPDA
jgi:hypothetical protein